jgi:uncharacterized SAM-binding protein YcdF (DUF218 family)
VFFVLSKTLDMALAPLTWLFVIGAIAVLRLRRAQELRSAGGLAAMLFVLAVLATEPVANRLTSLLESGVTPADPRATYDAVVLMGGILENGATQTWKVPAYNQSSERLLAVYEVLRSNRARYVILSGGDPQAPEPMHEARVCERQLIEWGIDPGRIIVDLDSKNTRENAINSVRIARERGLERIGVVTSAFHMPRSVDCFRAAGMDVTPVAVDFRSNEMPLARRTFLPRAAWLGDSTWALRELAGRLVYRVVGFSR